MYGAAGGHSPYGMPNQTGGKPNKKRKPLTPKQKAQIMQERKALAARQQMAMRNAEYRRKIEAINQSRGGLDRTLYKLAEDRKPKKERDYFYVMRKGVCFLMFLFIIVTISVFVLSYLNLQMIPKKYISMFINIEISEEGQASITAEHFVTDPIFGFIKNISGKIMKNPISLGESPLYDEMLAKSEIGMGSIVTKIALEYFPIALIIYVITALIMMLKAFLGIFGKRIFKKFGLGSFILIICGGITAFGGLIYITEPNAPIAYAAIIDLLTGGVTGKSGFTAGYGLLALIALPILVLLCSMFCKKRVPYSIFDN